jgi:glyoxylase-like metal-dependent hydrolase (beta-lactamase superfamily II)/rhodanese-related sulfurtransferase
MIFKELNHSQCKTYLIGCRDTRSAILVDPLFDRVDRYLALLGYYGLDLRYALDTHTHADHRSGCFELREFLDCKIIRHQMSPQPNIDIHVEDGDSIQVGKLEIKVLYTPGHTPDSMSLLLNDRVLTGDVLLNGGTGRSDFAGGDPGAQYDSITGKLFTLPGETRIYPGHDYRGNKYSTVEQELNHNPRISGKSKTEYIGIMNNLDLPLPEKIQEVLFTNITEEDDKEFNLPSISQLNDVHQISPEGLGVLVSQEQQPLIVDVRNPDEYTGELGHIQGSINIPLKDLADRHQEIEDYKNQQLVLVCRSGVRSTTAAALLTGLGFKQVYDLKGGMVRWNIKAK